MDHLIKTTGTFMIVVACMAEPIHAAEITDSSDAIELEVLVVTATRSALSLADAPAAVTVVDAKKIETKNVSRLGDALDQVPSLYLQNGAFGPSQGTSGTSGMSLRGIDQSRTLILLDGQPIQDASSGKVNWRIPFVEDIERIEVVPGAFSSLYGSNAIGGVINIITKQPDRREFSVKLKKGWNDLSGEDGSVYFRDTLESGLGIVAGLGYQKRDSFVNDFVVKTPSGAAGTLVTGGQATTTREGDPAYLVGDKGRTPWTSANATLKLSYKLDARDKVFGGVSYQETNQDYTAFNTYLRNAASGLPISSGPVNINNEQYARLSVFDFVNNSPLYESATRYFAGYEGTIGKDTLLKVDLAKIDRDYYFTFVNPADPGASLNSGRGTLTDTPNSGLDGTIQLSFPAGEKHFWVTGLALHRDEANQKTYVLTNWRDPDTRTTLNNEFDGTSTTTSLFAQDEITLTDTLKAYLGGRWDYWETKGDVFNSDTRLPTSIFPSRSDSAFSPKASVVYKPVEAATLRASYGRSFRAPANLDLYSTAFSRNRITYNNPDLKPETGTTWEVGGEWRFTNSTQAGLTVYETRLKNLIYLDQVEELSPDGLAQSFRINAGKARVRGLELTARTRLTNWLVLDANYAYIDSEMLENAADPDSVGKRLTNSPKHIAGIGLTAQHGPWTGTLNARYVSHVYFTAANTDVVEGVPGSYDAYTLVNAKAGYAFSKTVKASLGINNLLDEEAYSFFLLPGRSAVAELDFSF
ncbi:MAG TPA: TonB-dependent receptor [Thiobacillus sp.]|nr:TonB-dependent receptor [Thiobacillus sp.]